ncbi:hypothetical protein SXIM_29500 [Streptomyces xiamenensis]|uniref:Uncharacterized protein n=1 Tax=Streptomyces xiamenensis TaxID=408015 RepID=A0A0F7FWG7_9ACTN|nr:hypothetical protein SXIM_29500 [Streptomyces xiamenensis]
MQHQLGQALGKSGGGGGLRRHTESSVSPGGGERRTNIGKIYPFRVRM